MNYESFVEHLNSHLGNTVYSDSHALVCVRTEGGRGLCFTSAIEFVLSDQVGSSVKFAELRSGRFLMLLSQVTLDQALRVTRQLRYMLGYLDRSDENSCGPFGIVTFGNDCSDSDYLIDCAQQTAMEAGDGNRIKCYALNRESDREEYV